MENLHMIMRVQPIGVKKKHKGKHRNKCYFKFGIYTNANLKAEHKHEAEGMTVFADYMAMAKTEEKLEELLLKDK